MLKIVIGTSVEGANFYGRDAELTTLERMLETDHVLLLAPRRVGKSSVLKAMLPGPTADGRFPVFVDVQDVRTERDFVQALVAAIHAHPGAKKLRPGWLAQRRAKSSSRVQSLQLPGGVGFELKDVEHGWQAAADHAFDQLLAIDARWLILVDELPNVVVALAAADPTAVRARAFLSWFRRLRQRRDAADKLRFVLCGSIGLDAVARRHVLSDTINDLRSWTLGPFDADTADSFVAELADAYEWVMAPAVRTRILAEIEWLIPHHLQGVMSELMHQPHGGIVDERHVVAAIEALIGRRNYFNSWDERLTPSLGTPHDGHARVILRQCARDPRGAIGASVNAAMADEIADARTRATAIAELRDVLSHDGYLVEDGERLRFRSSILRRFWARHFP